MQTELEWPSARAGHIGIGLAQVEHSHIERVVRFGVQLDKGSVARGELVNVGAAMCARWVAVMAKLL